MQTRDRRRRRRRKRRDRWTTYGLAWMTSDNGIDRYCRSRAGTVLTINQCVYNDNGKDYLHARPLGECVTSHSHVTRSICRRRCFSSAAARYVMFDAYDHRYCRRANRSCLMARQQKWLSSCISAPTDKKHKCIG